MKVKWGGGAPQVGDPTLTPSPAITSSNIGPSTKIPEKNTSIVFEPDEGIDDHPESPEVPMAPIDSTLGLVFPEDTNSDGHLSPAENNKWKKYTSLIIKLPEGAAVGDEVHAQMDEYWEWAPSKQITEEHLKKGYIDFGESVPILNYEKINVEAHITHDGATSVVKKPLIIDPDPLRGLDLYILRINNYNNKIGDSDLGNRTVRAIIQLNNAEKINKGYEIEVEVNGKFVKAHKQTDGTFAADIRLADLKDDSDKKIIAKLKKATYNYDNGDGTFSIKDAPELEARGEMINLDLVFNDLHNLLSNNNNIIKLWGDNDNNVTLRSEANKTFSVAADQSAVASQPYTRYEASDTASGTKYYIDVHNDINLQIL